MTSALTSFDQNCTQMNWKLFEDYDEQHFCFKHKWVTWCPEQTEHFSVLLICFWEHWPFVLSKDNLVYNDPEDKHIFMNRPLKSDKLVHSRKMLITVAITYDKVLHHYFTEWGEKSLFRQSYCSASLCMYQYTVQYVPDQACFGFTESFFHFVNAVAMVFTVSWLHSFASLQCS